MQNILDNNIQKELDKLRSLIVGFSCEKFEPRVEKLGSFGQIYANAGGILNLDSMPLQKRNLERKKNIYFFGSRLVGGIWNEEKQAFFSDDLRYKYEMNLLKNELKITAICENKSFLVNGFFKGDFNLNFSQNPKREIAILINSTKKNSKAFCALSDILESICKYIFKADEYSKIVLGHFSSLNAIICGEFYNAENFINSYNQIKIIDSDTRMLNLAIMRAISHFTKDNKLKKEVYLLNLKDPSDPHNEEKMLNLARTINQNIITNSNNSDEYCVKINTFDTTALAIETSLDKFLPKPKESSDFMQKIAEITGGQFFAPNNEFELKLALLSAISNGKSTFADINVIHSSKANKCYDPNNPQNDKILAV